MKKLTTILLLLLAATPFVRTAQAQEHAWMKYIKPSGYFQAGYTVTNSFTDHNNIDNGSFYIKRARLSISGDLLQSDKFGRLEYKVQADLANSPKLVDYWLKYTIRDEIGIQFGQFKTPLSIENSEVVPLKLEMIEYSLLVQRMVRMSTSDVSGISATGRELGLQLYGKIGKMADGHHVVRYNVAVFNGNGINKMDDDHRKDFMARLMVYPFKDLYVSGYYMRSLGPHSEIAPEYNDYDYFIYDRYGGGVSYNGKHAWARAEYMAGHTFGWRNEGAYVTAGYKILPNLGVGARVDYFTTNSREKGHAQLYYTGAVNWSPFKWLRLQLNYTCQQQPGLNYPLHCINFLSSISL